MTAPAAASTVWSSLPSVIVTDCVVSVMPSVIRLETSPVRGFILWIAARSRARPSAIPAFSDISERTPICVSSSAHCTSFENLIVTCTLRGLTVFWAYAVGVGDFCAPSPTISAFGAAVSTHFTCLPNF